MFCTANIKCWLGKCRLTPVGNCWGGGGVGGAHLNIYQLLGVRNIFLKNCKHFQKSNLQVTVFLLMLLFTDSLYVQAALLTERAMKQPRGPPPPPHLNWYFPRHIIILIITAFFLGGVCWWIIDECYNGGLLRNGTQNDFTFSWVLFVFLLVRNETQHQPIDFIDSVRPLFFKSVGFKVWLLSV